MASLSKPVGSSGGINYSVSIEYQPNRTPSGSTSTSLSEEQIKFEENFLRYLHECNSANSGLETNSAILKNLLDNPPTALHQVPDYETLIQKALHEYLTSLCIKKKSDQKFLRRTDDTHLKKYVKRSLVQRLLNQHPKKNLPKDMIRGVRQNISAQIAGLDTSWAQKQSDLSKERQQDARGILRLLQMPSAEALTEMRQLSKDHPLEYLRKASFYLEDQLVNKRFDLAIEFTAEWLQSIPKEASADQVELFGDIWIQLLGKKGSIPKDSLLVEEGFDLKQHVFLIVFIAFRLKVSLIKYYRLFLCFLPSRT